MCFIPEKKLRVVHQWPDENNELSRVESLVEPAYFGKCAVDLDEQLFLVFPSYEQALIAASYAIRLDVGGYQYAKIDGVSDDIELTHHCAQDWIFNV